MQFFNITLNETPHMYSGLTAMHNQDTIFGSSRPRCRLSVCMGVCMSVGRSYESLSSISSISFRPDARDGNQVRPPVQQLLLLLLLLFPSSSASVSLVSVPPSRLQHGRGRRSRISGAGFLDLQSGPAGLEADDGQHASAPWPLKNE